MKQIYTTLCFLCFLFISHSQNFNLFDLEVEKQLQIRAEHEIDSSWIRNPGEIKSVLRYQYDSIENYYSQKNVLNRLNEDTLLLERSIEYSLSEPDEIKEHAYKYDAKHRIIEYRLSTRNKYLGSYDTRKRTRYFYDKMTDRCTQVHLFQWNHDNQEWNIQEKRDSLFDSGGNIIRIIKKHYDPATSKMMTENKDSLVYNDKGQQFLILHLGRDTIRSEWQLNNIDSTAYNDWGNKIYFEKRQLKYLNNEWYIQEQKRWQYDSSNQLLEEILSYHSYYADSLLQNERIRYTYSEKGNPDSIITCRWDSSIKAWQKKYLTKNKYDFKSRKTDQEYYSWNSANNIWKASNKLKWEYDENGKRITISEATSFPHLNNWLYISQIEYCFNKDGKLVQRKYTELNPFVQRPTSILTKYTYDSTGKKILSENQYINYLYGERSVLTHFKSYIWPKTIISDQLFWIDHTEPTQLDPDSIYAGSKCTGHVKFSFLEGNEEGIFSIDSETKKLLIEKPDKLQFYYSHRIPLRIEAEIFNDSNKKDTAKFIVRILGQDLIDPSYSNIKETLLKNRPVSENLELRYQALTEVDEMVKNAVPNLPSGIRDFIRFMQQKLILEVKNEVVTEGATIWLFENHGFIIKTATTCFGIDLFSFFNIKDLMELADIIDVLFITHWHGDHTDLRLNEKMIKLGKNVVGPVEAPGLGYNIPMSSGEKKDIDNLKVTAHYADHGETPARQYEITTPEGIRILHTGDNKSSKTIPELEDLDILLINSWVKSRHESINKAKPKLCIPAHIYEFSHPSRYWLDVTYDDLFHDANIELPCEYPVMTWGERYHYTSEKNDSINPHAPSDQSFTVARDSIILNWKPVEAEDGELASFYRLKNKSYGEKLLEENRFSFYFDSLGMFDFKLYAYDHCGNQSEKTSFNVLLTNETNYAPRIVDCYPNTNDTISVFSGVISEFKARSFDVNKDSLSFSWTLNDKVIPDVDSSRFIYMGKGLESGSYKLKLLVGDGKSTSENTWILNHFNDSAVIDDQNPFMFSTQGSWDFEKWPVAFDGMKHSLYGNKKEVWANYLFYPEKEGYYDLYAYIPQHQSLTIRAVYSVEIDGLEDQIFPFNMKSNADKWTKVGQFHVPKETFELNIKLTDNGSNRLFVVADAIGLKHKGNTENVGEIKDNNQPILCFPNPVQQKLNVKLNIPSPHQVQIVVYNLLGEAIKTLVSDDLSGKEFIYEWDILNEPDGIYFLRMELNGETFTYKIIVSK